MGLWKLRREPGPARRRCGDNDLSVRAPTEAAAPERSYLIRIRSGFAIDARPTASIRRSPPENAPPGAVYARRAATSETRSLPGRVLNEPSRTTWCAQEPTQPLPGSPPPPNHDLRALGLRRFLTNTLQAQDGPRGATGCRAPFCSRARRTTDRLRRRGAEEGREGKRQPPRDLETTQREMSLGLSLRRPVRNNDDGPSHDTWPDTASRCHTAGATSGSIRASPRPRRALAPTG